MPAPIFSPGPAALADITQGRRLWRHQAPGLSAQLVDYPPGREMPRHSHRTANITIVLAGQFEEEIEGHQFVGGPLSVVYKPAGSVHATRTGESGTRTLVVEVEGPLEDELRRRYALFDDCRWFHALCGLAPCVLGLVRDVRDGTHRGIESWFARMRKVMASSPGLRMSPGVGVHVRRAIEILRSDRLVSTAMLAERLGLHPVYLARLFRTRLGLTPARVRQGMRLGTALDQIVQMGKPPAHAALEAGFSDQCHLSRQVKRYAGVSAGALRRLGQDGESRPNRG